MAHICADSGVVASINVFTVEPKNQQRLVDLLTKATDMSVSKAAGFLSASLRRSVDGTKVALYAQWASAETIGRCARTRRHCRIFRKP